MATANADRNGKGVRVAAWIFPLAVHRNAKIPRTRVCCASVSVSAPFIWWFCLVFFVSGLCALQSIVLYALAFFRFTFPIHTASRRVTELFRRSQQRTISGCSPSYILAKSCFNFSFPFNCYLFWPLRAAHWRQISILLLLHSSIPGRRHSPPLLSRVSIAQSFCSLFHVIVVCLYMHFGFSVYGSVYGVCAIIKFRKENPE